MSLVKEQTVASLLTTASEKKGHPQWLQKYLCNNDSTPEMAKIQFECKAIVGWPDKRRSNRVVLDFFVSFFIKKKRKELKHDRIHELKTLFYK